MVNRVYLLCCVVGLNLIWNCWFTKGGGSETEVTWEDQQNINKFGRLNNRFHELEVEIKVAKVLLWYGFCFIFLFVYDFSIRGCYNRFGLNLMCFHFVFFFIYMVWTVFIFTFLGIEHCHFLFGNVSHWLCCIIWGGFREIFKTQL